MRQAPLLTLSLIVTAVLCALVYFAPFSVGLILTLLSAPLFFWILRRTNALHTSPFSSFFWLGAHAAIVMVFCFATVGRFVGWGENGSPAIALEAQRRIEYSGNYLGSDTPQATLRSPADDATPSGNSAILLNEALQPGERIGLRATPNAKTQSTSWHVTVTTARRPVRLNGWVVNPNVQWLSPGEGGQFTVSAPGGKKRIEVSWLGTISSSWGRGVHDRFRYKQDNCRDGKDCAVEIELSPMREGQPLDQLLRRLIAAAPAGKFARLYNESEFAAQTADTFIVRAYSGSEEATSDPLRKNRASSALGLLKPGAATPNAIDTNATAQRATILSYGLGTGVGTFALQLPANTRTFDQGAGQKLRTWPLLFNAPQRWPIPNENDYLRAPNPANRSGGRREFLLTSSRQYIPLPGYFLEGNGRQHEFFARGTLRANMGSWSVTDGKMARQNDAAPKLGEVVALGDKIQGALVSLEPTRTVYDFTGRKAALRLGLMLALYATMIWLLRRNPDGLAQDATASDGAWHLLWASAALLATVRLILAYRADLLPPADATLYELRAMFGDSLRQSLWLMFWAPAAVVGARLVTFTLESQWRLPKLFSALIGAALLILLLANALRPDALWPALLALPVFALSVAAILQGRRFAPFLRNWEDALTARLSALGARLPTSWKDWLIGLWLSATALLLLLGLFGRKLPGSANALTIITLVLLVGASARIVYLVERDGFSARWLSHIAPKRTRAGLKSQRAQSGAAFWFTVALAIVSLLVLGVLLDAGLLILLFPLGFALTFLLWTQRRGSRISLIVAPSAVLLSAVFLLWILPRTPLATSIPTSQEETAIFYRLSVLSQREDEILLDGDTARSAPEVVLDNIRRNAQQQWQMLHYAQQGRYNPTGYGGAPLSKQSMTYDTALSDCVFAVFIVSEHGRTGALAILGIYLLVGGACLWGVAALPAARAYRAAPLALIGGFFVCQSLYMAAANIGMTVFTGQNLPLLSLRSGSDALQGVILLALAAFFLTKGAQSEAHEMDDDNSQIAVASGMFMGLALAGWFLVGWGLNRLPRPQAYNMDDAVLAQLRQNPPVYDESGKQGAPISWHWAEGPGSRAILTTAANVSLLEKQYARAFNGLSREAQRNRNGVYYLATTGNFGGTASGEEVRVNTDAFRISSPYDRAQPWTGAVLARGPQAPQPTLGALGQTFSISLNSDARAIPIAVDFDGHSGANAQESQRGLRRVVLVERGGGTTLAEIERVPGKDQITVFPGRASGYGVWLNGKSLKGAVTSGEQRKTLAQFDILAIERLRDGRRVNLIFLGDQAPPLAFSQWRNGSSETFYRQSDIFPWSAAILDVARGQNREREINLSLDLPLHEALQRRLSAWAKSQRDFRHSAQSAARANQQRLALSLIDAYSGEVLALPSWPLRDPNSPEFAAITDPVEHQYLLTNHNLINHAVGSTIKPITFAAMSSQLWGAMDISQVTVPRRSDGLTATYNTLGNLKLDKPFQADGDPLMTMSGAPGALGDNFMLRSRNWPHVVLGALGTIQKPDEWKQVLRPTNAGHADLFYAGQPFRLDLTGLNDSAISIGTKTQNPRFVPSKVKSSILFQGYRSIADIAYSSQRAELDAFRARNMAQQWPGLSPAPLKEGQKLDDRQRQNRRYFLNSLRQISPETVSVAPEEMSTIRGDFISFLLGSGENKWNNVTLSETFARLATGQKVEATFESRAGKTPQWATMPAPWDAATPKTRAWKAQNFFHVLEGVGENPRGTAYSYLQGRTGKYIGLFKTGTVNEDKTPLNSETLAFVVGEFRGAPATGGSFVPGRTVAGYLYMQKANRNNVDDGIRRRTLFPGLLQEITEFLDSRSAS